MTQFDLFSMIFLTLDHYWDENKGEELGQFLSSMNPFLFEGEGSVVPDVFTDFCKNVGGREITIDNSYQIACEYVDCIGIESVKEAFSWIDDGTWMKKCRKYLETEYD